MNKLNPGDLVIYDGDYVLIERFVKVNGTKMAMIRLSAAGDLKAVTLKSLQIPLTGTKKIKIRRPFKKTA